MTSPTDAQIPRTLPVVPGLVLAGQYALTECHPRHRGDTLGACALPHGRIGLMVADVVGHGPAASIAAAQVGAVLWAFLCEGAGLTEALEGLDRHAARHPELLATAVGVAVLDPADGSLEYAAAGLLPPLVLTPRGPPTLLAAVPMRPLGTGGTMHVHQAVLLPDEMLVMSTNGLVNTPSCGLDRASGDLAARAARALDESAAGGSLPCERAGDVGRSMVAPHAPTEVCDDVAVLVAQRMPRSADLVMELDADTFDVCELRSSVSGWLDGLGAGLADHVGLGHVLAELATNVVNHAYVRSDRSAAAGRGRVDRPFRIDAELRETGELVATVADRGEWRRPGQGNGAGRGMTMAAGLVDSLRVDRCPTGTVVEIRTRLGRPVQLWQAESDPAYFTPNLPDELSAVTGDGRLTASGPLDEASADYFHAALVEVTHAGTAAATVDLTGITHLASPGVQSLFDLAGRSERSGVRMDIVAPARTPARQILDLVGLAAGP